jgi:asparagine synthase (glutamine-hydrolysing)
MCGICGKVGIDPVKKDEILVMMTALKHRGPDDEGLYLKKRVGLGHTRLSIIDLNTGRQPISNEDGTVWIVFNGEIYNYQSLRKMLEGKGHKFATQTDTEVIVHAYEEYGESCVKKLSGMFAFALWDERNQKLILGRDRIGQKPLFYAQPGRNFLFASEIKALLENQDVSTELDVQAMHHYLSLRFVPQPYTMFLGVRKLPPAHILVYERGRVRIERYWDLSYIPKFDISERELVSNLKEMLIKTIKIHLVSDVPVGTFLSGGLDSSLVTAIAATVSHQPIQTFTMAINQRGFNELPYARQVAERYHTIHHDWLVQPDILEALPELIWHMDEPSDPLATCVYSIARLTRENVKVVLGGDGGDELFGGYERYWGNQILGYYSLMPRFLREQVIARLIQLMPDGHTYKSLVQKLRWMNTLSFYEGSQRYAQAMIFPWFDRTAKRSLYTESWLNKLDGDDPSEHITKFFEGAQAGEMIDRMLYADLCTRLPEHSLMILDRMAMAFGLEGRSPYLDHSLVEFVAKIPTSLKLKGMNLRYIQKEVAREFLPPELLTREKQGFSTALPYLLKDQLKGILAELVGNSFLVADGYFKGTGLVQLFEDHFSRGIDHSNRLWMILNLEVWYRLFIKKEHRTTTLSGIFRVQG